MTGLIGHPWARRIIATIGVLASIGVAGWYALVAALSVPFPAAWVFVGVGLTGIAMAARWWGSHPGRALAVPIVVFALLTIGLELGVSLWGWGP